LRLQLARQLDRFFPVACLADHNDIRLILQYPSKATPDQAVVIDKQHTDLLCHIWLF
jgi:hypothetical protein